MTDTSAHSTDDPTTIDHHDDEAIDTTSSSTEEPEDRLRRWLWIGVIGGFLLIVALLGHFLMALALFCWGLAWVFFLKGVNWNVVRTRRARLFCLAAWLVIGFLGLLFWVLDAKLTM